MSAHLSNEIVERFHAQELTPQDSSAIYGHVLDCESCRRRVVTSEAEAVAVTALTDHLLSRVDEEPYYLDPTTIEAFIDDKLDAFDRNLAKLHLEDCAECSDEVTDLRGLLATMKAASRTAEVRPQPTTSPQLPRFSIPMRIAAAIALVSFAAVAVFVLWRMRSTSTGQPPGGRDVTVETQPTPLFSRAFPTPGLTSP